MRIRGRIGADYSPLSFSCGTWISRLLPDGTRSFQYRCRSWHCAVGFCDRERRSDYTRRICDSFARLAFVYCARRRESGERLSGWIKRNVPGSYWRISSDEDSLILSNRLITGASKVHGQRLSELVRTELEKPWSGEGNRVSHSKVFGRSRPPRNESSVCYGLMREADARAFSDLSTERDRAHWLFQHRHLMLRAFPACDDLLDQYRAFWPQW